MTSQDPATSVEPGEEVGTPVSPPGMPRWVKVSLITVASLVLLFVVLALIGVGGEHGPGRHASAVQSSAVSLVVKSAA